MAKKIVETPLMKQYLDMKKKHPDAILLFRVGDFYETFSDDAIAASEILGITLTKRANGAAMSVELAGFPYHALDTYLPKLIRAGRRVAICEQLEDPKLTKKLVKRDIIELVTPGVALSDNVLDVRSNNFLAAIHPGRNVSGVAFLDISTGEFLCAEGSMDYIDKLMSGFTPKEVLVVRGRRQQIESQLSAKYLIYELDDWVFTADSARERLLKQFRTASMKGFGVDGMPSAEIAAGAILHYLDVTRHSGATHIRRLTRIEESRFVRLDRFTIRNLELVDSFADEGKSLLSVIDRTVTPPGSRLLRRWIQFPLRDPDAINARLDIVEEFFRFPDQREMLREHLEQTGDMERLTSKLSFGRISPRELVQLRHSLEALVPVKKICAESRLQTLNGMGSRINLCVKVCSRISSTIMEDAPAVLHRGNTIAPGFNAELDSLREIAYKGKDYLQEIQKRESAATGIPSLKIGFNNVFGYYIEVTNAHRNKVPAEWIRKQTLVNAERYITPELKEYEEKILGAQEKIEALEERIFNALVAEICDYNQAIQENSTVVAQLDVLTSFTCVAIENRYVRPVVDSSSEIIIRQGRHPVIEKQLPPGTPYVANTVEISSGGTQIMMITGPNMSGKSALLRSVALNVLMAQTGCFVAADSARIGVVDKIFTRVGASDNLAQGESTFMVEMNEAASILNNMTGKSLILFDELGRGTSTYDGISIAWAIVEHIHQHPVHHPRTLFATHYHELNEMEKSYPRIANYNVAVQELDGKVVFLRKLVRGGSEHSFGIHVAQLAGMPEDIVSRATEMLEYLEKKNPASDRAPILEQEDKPSAKGQTAKPAGGEMQLSFFTLDDPVLAQIRDEILTTDINRLTPVDALNKLNEIKTILTGK